MKSQRELEGRVALVTGAAKNIGRTIALDLASAGAGVIVTALGNIEGARSVAAEVEAMGGKAHAALADVTLPDDIARLRGEVESRFGRLDILVNNAAIRHEKSLDEMSYADWRAVTSVILDGAFICVTAMLPLLKASGQGAIINMGGMSAYTGAKNRVHVLAAKSGLAGLTRGFAHDLASSAITANLVSPGLIATQRGGSSHANPDHHRHNATLTGERGAPQEVASMVRYLAGPHARYITGQTIHVNGGAFVP